MSLQGKCRLCRREGEKLFLKGPKCLSDKCPIERRPYPPGMHGQRRRPARGSDYGVQLREKQKVKRMYGLQEGQFHRYFEMADSKDGITGLNLLQLLETRLDTVVFRMGFSSSRAEARQLVRHKHVRVNGRVLNIPSANIKEGDKIDIVDKAREHLRVKASTEQAAGRGVAEWLDVDLSAFQGTFVSLPMRDQLDQSIREQLIVELYSK